jgi:hypothetical protein
LPTNRQILDAFGYKYYEENIMKLIEKNATYQHRDFSNPELVKHTFGKKGLPAFPSNINLRLVPPTRNTKDIADAIVARLPDEDHVGLRKVLLHGASADVHIAHELDQANLNEE